MYHVTREPFDWVYSQSSGHFFLSDSEDVRAFIARGYSGAIGHQNKPESQNLVALGPIPRGVWRIGAAYHHKRLGRLSIPIEAADPKTALGRSGFFIHGDNSASNGSASSGCIVLDFATRQFIEAARVGSRVRTLVVVR